MKVSGVIVYAYTPAFERMREFYEAGTGLRGEAAGPIWVAFPMGASKFGLHKQGHEDPEDPGDFRLDFLVDDIVAVLARFEAAGAEVVRGIQDEAFGRSAVLRDPEGREFTLVQEELD